MIKCLAIIQLNWNLKMLVFEEKEKPEYPEKNLSEQGREPPTNSTHITYIIEEILHICFLCVYRYYHVISWGLPLIVACLPFSEDIYGPAGPWW